MSTHMHHALPARVARTGFTLVEMAIASTILILLSAALLSSLDSLRETTLTGNVESKLQEAGERAMRQVISDLRRSGQVTVAGTTYPGFFLDGDAFGDFAGHAHVPPVEYAAANEASFGQNREIVFLLPRDDDTWGPPPVAGTPDGIPDLDNNASLIWDDTEISYVLVTGADGVNRLERRTNAANPRNIASWVERIVFDDMTTDVTLLPDTVRVQIFLRQVDTAGQVHRYQSDATVRLRNGI